MNVTASTSNSFNCVSACGDCFGRCYNRISEFFLSCSDYFYESPPGRLYNRHIRPRTTLITGMSGVVTNLANARVFHLFLNFLSHSSSATQGTWRHYDLMLRIVKSAKILAAVTIPFALYSIGREVQKLFSGSSKIDAILRIFEDMGWLSDSTATFVNGLSMIGSYGETAAQWALGLTAAGTLLSTATILYNTKHLYQNIQTLKHTQNQTTDTVLNILTVKPDEPSNLYGIEKSKLDALDSLSETNKEEAVRLLAKRIKNKNFSHGLAIVSAIISLIGMAILLLSPFAILSYSLLALASAISVIKFFYENRSVRRLELGIEFLVSIKSPT